MIVVLAAVRFFVRLCKNFEGILTYVEKFLCNMTEKMTIDRTAKAEPVIVRCCLNGFLEVIFRFRKGILRIHENRSV